MRRAYYQAEDYAEALPEWPLFLFAVDIGYSTELYADFSLTGKAYLAFPDPRIFSNPECWPTLAGFRRSAGYPPQAALALRHPGAVPRGQGSHAFRRAPNATTDRHRVPPRAPHPRGRNPRHPPSPRPGPRIFRPLLPLRTQALHRSIEDPP